MLAVGRWCGYRSLLCAFVRGVCAYVAETGFKKKSYLCQNTKRMSTQYMKKENYRSTTGTSSKKRYEIPLKISILKKKFPWNPVGTENG